MAISAFKLRSALGGVNVALSQVEGIFSGVVKDTPEKRQEVLQMLRDGAAILQEEAKLVEAKRTPTIKEWDAQGGEKFFGSVPFVYPTHPHPDCAIPASLLPEPIITAEGVESLAKMVK
jgi:hypothetical protein